MSKFIELHYAVDGKPIIISTEMIARFTPAYKSEIDGMSREEDGVYIARTDKCYMYVKESYEEVKAMLKDDTQIQVTANMVGEVRDICINRRCDICPYRGHENGCENALIADHLNKRLKGAIK